ncbi:MAG: copper amine oxidase N-terminal domain-containing protein [Deltaproteobacteria bacterium]
MNRKLSLLLVLCMIFLFTITGICSADIVPYKYCKCIKLIPRQKQAQLNSQPVIMEHPAYIKNGCTLVPFRFLADSLGARVTWNPDTLQAKLRLADKQAIVCVGSKTAYSLDKLTTLDVAPEIREGCLFVPLRFMTESLGAYVTFESKTNSITITCINKARWGWDSDPKNDIWYWYPEDWAISHDDKNDATKFTSPNGSVLYIKEYEGSPAEYYQFIKKEAQDQGLELNYEKKYAPGSYDEGFELHYTDISSDSAKQNRCYYLVFPYLAGEFKMNDDVTDLDYYVAYEILMNWDY